MTRKTTRSMKAKSQGKVGWWFRFQDVLRLSYRTWQRTRACDVQFLAASLAFSTVVSIVPLMAVSLSVFKAYGGAKILMARIEPFILENFVEASGVHISEMIKSSIQNIESGVLGVTGSIFLFFTSTRLLLSLETAVDRVWDERVSPFRFKKLLVYWIFLFVGPLILAIAIGFWGSRETGLHHLAPRHTLAFLFTIIILFCLYAYVPKRTVRWRWALLSSFLATVAIALAQHFYAQVTTQLLRYNKIYGSLAAVPVFLIWILILWWIFFIGVALCATLEETST